MIFNDNEGGVRDSRMSSLVALREREGLFPAPRLLPYFLMFRAEDAASTLSELTAIVAADCGNIQSLDFLVKYS